MTDQIASPATSAVPLAAHGADPLTGRFATPGDKSISHRALILGALAVGRTSIEGLLEAEDVMATATALRQLGVRVDRHDGAWHVHGLGVGGLLEPQGWLDFGNAGTGARLMLGLLAPYDFASRFTGGPTLTRRPLGPLLEALEMMGASVEATNAGHLPLTLRGTATPLPICRSAPSEPVKSALLLAGLQIAGTTEIRETVATRDHTEKLLAEFGADITVTPDEAGGTTIRLVGLSELRPRHIVVPGDPASAAYAIVAALIVPGSDLVVENVLVSPMRTGLIDTLLEMGGDIQFLNQRQTSGEPVADLHVRASRLKGVRVDAGHAAAMLEDIPVLAVAAAFAQGETTIEGLGELRLQECDRLAATAAGLAANRVTVREDGDSLSVTGHGKVDGGGTVETRQDHRIAMSFLVLGLASKHQVRVDDAGAIAASFPGFVAAMTAIGGRFPPVKGH